MERQPASNSSAQSFVMAQGLRVINTKQYQQEEATLPPPVMQPIILYDIPSKLPKRDEHQPSKDEVLAARVALAT
jgi:hypothetical protein